MEFNIGNIVEVYGRDAVLEYTYGHKYGDGTKRGDWSVIFLDDGNSIAWISESEMKFKSIGSLSEVKKAKQTRNKIKQRNRDLNYIKELMINNKALSSDSILKLFEEIEYDSSFNRNGEYFILQNDFLALQPIFNSIFKNNLNEMLSSIEGIFKKDYVEFYKIKCMELFNKVNEINIK